MRHLCSTRVNIPNSKQTFKLTVTQALSLHLSLSSLSWLASTSQITVSRTHFFSLIHSVKQPSLVMEKGALFCVCVCWQVHKFTRKYHCKKFIFYFQARHIHNNYLTFTMSSWGKLLNSPLSNMSKSFVIVIVVISIIIKSARYY